MKKFTLLIASLFITIGAMAQSYTFEKITLTEDMLYTNAPCTNTQWGDQFTSYTVLLDNNSNTFLHTEYANNGASLDGLDHYLRVDLGAGNEISAFKFNYTTRGGNAQADFPQKFIIAGSNEENGTYTEIGRVESGLPTSRGTAWESSVFTSETAYRYLRFMVTETTTDRKGAGVEHNYWHMGEFGLSKATPEVVYETEEVGNPTEDGVYRIYWKGQDRGYLAYHDEYPTKPVLADVDLSGYNGIDKHYKSTESGVQRDWYLITSESGKKYLFSPYTGKFLTYSKEAADTGKGALYDANRPLEVAVEANTNASWSNYYILTATIDNVKLLLSSGCGTASRGNTAGYPVRWVNAEGDNSQMHDGGSPLTFVKVIGFPAVDEAIMAQAKAAIDDYENPVEDNVTLQWTTSTPWATATDLTSTVLNDNAYTGGIKYVELENAITVAGARTVTATFAYTGGDCRLNMRGVEVVDENGNIVAGDYHVGYAGGQVQNPTYTVKIAEAGTYSVRCYVTEGDDGDGNIDNLNRTAGNITVAFAKLNVMDLTKEVTFAAEYATLHLGYSVAVPAGVEAYVVSATNATWADMEQVNNVIPAATPVILKKTGTGTTYNFYYTSGEADEIETNLLKGSIADRYVAADAYVLGINNEKVGLYTATKNQLSNTAFKNNANKAYLPKTTEMNVASYSFRFGEGTTGIDEITDNREQSTVIYDLTGRRVETITEPGIYIVGGKKVLVK